MKTYKIYIQTFFNLHNQSTICTISQHFQKQDNHINMLFLEQNISFINICEKGIPRKNQN